MNALDLPLDMNKVPFSRAESWLVVSQWEPGQQGKPEGLWLRHIYGGQHVHMFRIDALANGQPVPVRISACPHCLTLATNEGRIEFVMPEPNTIRVRGCGLGLRLESAPEPNKTRTVLIPAGADRWRCIMNVAKILLTPIAGPMDVVADWGPGPGVRARTHRTDPNRITLGGEGEEWEFQINAYESEMEPPAITDAFDRARERAAADFSAWREHCPSVPERYAAARALAAYINWSAVVPAAGHFSTPAMLMSKNGMLSAWNWDNYINAWANAFRDPPFAWKQFMLHFSHQHSTGALPDGINEQKVWWSHAKPPVHGWILRRMMEATDAIGLDQIRQVYEPLCRATEWWFRYRDDDRDGICQYHHGNDSGWDDATAFDGGCPVEAPDLNALLVLQMEVLGDLAGRLDRPDEAAAWHNRSTAMLECFIEHSWRDGQFATLISGTHTAATGGESLLNTMPLILGRRLPENLRRDMIAGLTRPNRFVTEWGLASEAVNSPEYLSQGYWRGSIWPPPALFVADGLRDMGETDLAADLAERFCRLTATHGFGECHDALTGEIHYDPAYTWSASVFLLLAHLHLADAPGRTAGMGKTLASP